MFKVKLCPECGVPRYITDEHAWLSDGSIVQSRSPEHRMAFMETENFDPLFMGIQELIGVPITHILTDAARWSTLMYLSRVLDENTASVAQTDEKQARIALEVMFEVSRVLGYGNPSLVEMRFGEDAGDSLTIRYRDPFSIPLVAGTVAGTGGVFTGRSFGVTVEERSAGEIDITVRREERPEGLRSRLRVPPYRPREGPIRHSRCPSCDGPYNLRRYDWGSDDGIIRSTSTGRRFALIGPPIVEAVFAELEYELGESIPEVVIEAQRRFVRNGPYLLSEIHGEEHLREQFARRGFGCVESLEMGRAGMKLRLANAVLHTMLIGFAQGFYELAYGMESRVEWSISEDRLLEVEVRPWG